MHVIFFLAGRLGAYLCHSLSGLWVWAPRRVRIDVLTGNRSKQAPELRRQRILDFIVLIIRSFCGVLANGSGEINLSNRGDERDDGDAMNLTQVEFCDRTSGDTAYSFPCAATSSTG